MIIMMIIIIIIMNKICKAKKRPELKALGRLKWKLDNFSFSVI